MRTIHTLLLREPLLSETLETSSYQEKHPHEDSDSYDPHYQLCSPIASCVPRDGCVWIRSVVAVLAKILDRF